MSTGSLNTNRVAGIVEVSRVVALVSFVLGSLILILFYLTNSAALIMVGSIFLVIAFVINCVFLLGLVMKLATDKSDRKRIVLSLVLILLNIPIVFLYAYWAIVSLPFDLD